MDFSSLLFCYHNLFILCWILNLDWCLIYWYSICLSNCHDFACHQNMFIWLTSAQNQPSPAPMWLSQIDCCQVWAPSWFSCSFLCLLCDVSGPPCPLWAVQHPKRGQGVSRWRRACDRVVTSELSLSEFVPAWQACRKGSQACRKGSQVCRERNNLSTTFASCFHLLASGHSSISTGKPTFMQVCNVFADLNHISSDLSTQLHASGLVWSAKAQILQRILGFQGSIPSGMICRWNYSQHRHRCDGGWFMHGAGIPKPAYLTGLKGVSDNAATSVK